MEMVTGALSALGAFSIFSTSLKSKGGELLFVAVFGDGELIATQSFNGLAVAVGYFHVYFD
jgi:hypothetical protein